MNSLAGIDQFVSSCTEHGLTWRYLNVLKIVANVVRVCKTTIGMQCGAMRTLDQVIDGLTGYMKSHCIYACLPGQIGLRGQVIYGVFLQAKGGHHWIKHRQDTEDEVGVLHAESTKLKRFNGDGKTGSLLRLELGKTGGGHGQ